MAANIANFDPYNSDQIANIDSAWMEKLNEDDWTVNPAVFKYILPFRPSDYCGGQLAQTWEMTDLSTYVVHLHQGIHWQNIPPLNGREFVASDVVFHYDRIYFWRWRMGGLAIGDRS
jgi:ABC-type transport system substrate-binding protein